MKKWFQENVLFLVFFLPKSRKKCLLLPKYNIFNIIVTIDRVVFLNDILEG